MSVSGFSHVTIMCSDLDAALAFYREALELDIRDRPLPDGYPRAAIGHFSGGDWCLHFFQAPADGRSVKAGERSTGPFLHVSLRAEGYARTRARLTGLGVEIREFTIGDRHLVQFLDLDGVEIELTFSPSEVRGPPTP